MATGFFFRLGLPLIAALALAGCQATDGVSDRTAVLTGVGATAGGAIGAQQGGAQGGVFGAIIGGAAGFALGMMLDNMEREQIAQASVAAARSNRVQTRTFRNSKKQQVRTITRPVRTYKNDQGETCRQTVTSVSRDGQDMGNLNNTSCAVRTGRRVEWTEMG